MPETGLPHNKGLDLWLEDAAETSQIDIVKCKLSVCGESALNDVSDEQATHLWGVYVLSVHSGGPVSIDILGMSEELHGMHHESNVVFITLHWCLHCFLVLILLLMMFEWRSLGGKEFL